MQPILFMLRLQTLLIGSSVLFPAMASANDFTARKIKIAWQEDGTKEIVSDEVFQSSRPIPIRIDQYPQAIVEHQPLSGVKILELQSTDAVALQEWIDSHHVLKPRRTFQNPTDDIDVQYEVRTLVQNGSKENHIDLVFMGDGYTIEQKEQFFDDMNRLVKDMFIGQTFTSYLPLFNVYAVFQPSKMRGIGKGKPIDTAYKLYREGETLRAIFPGNPTAIRNACKQAPACDYPVVIGNDPYYGGLGGEFAISTSSPTSGSIVLRHELGHNFGRVGEEYDGGGYFGANNSFSATRVKWPQWSTEKVTSAEQQFARYLGWPWQNLTNNPFKINFKSDGIQKSTKIVLSASGIETSDTVSILLDGEPLSFESPNRVDRSFITLDLPPFSEGEHTFEVREAVSDGNNWLSNLSIHEFGHEMHDDPSFIGAFPVFSEDLSIDGYRPTNNSCLMRDMLHPFFCPVCQENNWLQFFSRISLIEDLSGKVEEDQVKVQLTTLKLGQFRTMGTAPQGEQLEIRWFYNGQELPELAGQSTWSKPIKAFPKDTSDAADVRLTKIEAQVKLVSPEIRKMAVTDKRSLML